MPDSSPASWQPRLARTIDVPATSLCANLDISAMRFPDKAALVFFDRITTYRELAAQVVRASAALRAIGVQPGDRVLLGAQNCPQLVIAHFAILHAGAVVVPVNPMNRAGELRHCITDAGARVAIALGDLAAEAAAASSELPAEARLTHLIVGAYADATDSASVATQALPSGWHAMLIAIPDLPDLPGTSVLRWTDWLAEAPALAGQPLVRADDLAVLPYTSGTTGHPKGCMHSHGSLMHNAVASQLWIGTTMKSVVLGAIPLFHITGMVTVMHGAVYSGATLVLMPRWDRETAARLIEHWQVSHWVNIPTMVIDLLGWAGLGRDALQSLAFIGGGGAAMPEAVASRLLERTGLQYVEGYGLTETAAPTHFCPPDRPKLRCLGVPFTDVEACVVDIETGEPVAQGQPGEIVVRGPSLFRGYWNLPDATEAAFLNLGGNRWFRTGDIGRVDEDGYFFMTDRLKRMINASGFKVWPAEVEAILFGHPAIQEACVIGTHDAYRGESVMAVVVLRGGCSATQEEIVAWSRGRMAAYKVPREIRFDTVLPKSGSGKVMWRTLQEAIAVGP
jgi:fatty-acyl-CoA synthase